MKATYPASEFDFDEQKKHASKLNMYACTHIIQSLREVRLQCCYKLHMHV